MAREQSGKNNRKAKEKDYKKKGSGQPPIPVASTKPPYASNQDKPTGMTSDGSFANVHTNFNNTNFTSGDNHLLNYSGP